MSKLVSVARSEGIEIAPSVANRIVDSSSGSVRSLLKILQAFIESEGTDDAVREAIAWRSADQAALEFLELCATEPSFASVVPRLQNNSPEAFRAGVENQLARLLVASSVGTATNCVDQAISSAVRASALRSGAVVASVWEQLIDVWKPHRSTATYAQLVRMTSMTHRQIGGLARPLVDTPLRPASLPHTIRRLNAANGSERFLSKAQLQRLWHAASAYSQAYGEGIRVLLDVQHSNAQAAAMTMSRLTHGIATNYIHNQGQLPPLGWMYVNRRTEAGLPVSTLALCAATTLLPRMQVWIERAADRLMSEGHIVAPLQPVANLSPDLKFQLKALRVFASFLDPTILEIDSNGTVTPLIDLLGVAESSRRSLGRPTGRYSVRLSQNLIEAMAKPGIEDAFSARQWHRIEAGWELAAYAGHRLEPGPK